MLRVLWPCSRSTRYIHEGVRLVQALQLELVTAGSPTPPLPSHVLVHRGVGHILIYRSSDALPFFAGSRSSLPAGSYFFLYFEAQVLTCRVLKRGRHLLLIFSTLMLSTCPCGQATCKGRFSPAVSLCYCQDKHGYTAGCFLVVGTSFVMSVRNRFAHHLTRTTDRRLHSARNPTGIEDCLHKKRSTSRLVLPL